MRRLVALVLFSFIQFSVANADTDCNEPRDFTKEELKWCDDESKTIELMEQEDLRNGESERAVAAWEKDTEDAIQFIRVALGKLKKQDDLHPQLVSEFNSNNLWVDIPSRYENARLILDWIKVNGQGVFSEADQKLALALEVRLIKRFPRYQRAYKALMDNEKF